METDSKDTKIIREILSVLAVLDCADIKRVRDYVYELWRKRLN